MTTKANPFSPFMDIDPNNFDLSKILGAFQLPGVDMEVLMAAQRKNIEALTEANRLLVQGLQAVARRQSEILTETMSTVPETAQQLARARDPKELAAQQADVAREAFGKALADMRRLAEVFSKSANDAVDVVGNRVVEGLGEVGTLASGK